VIVAVASALTEVVWIWKVFDVAPVGIRIDTGTVAATLFDDKVTV